MNSTTQFLLLIIGALLLNLAIVIGDWWIVMSAPFFIAGILPFGKKQKSQEQEQ